MHPFGRRRFRFPWRTRREVLRDVDAELTAHLAARADDLMSEGVAPDEARRLALEEFGDVAFTRAYCADEGRRLEHANRWTIVIDDLYRDLTFAVRLLTRQRGFTLVAVATLALAIGGNTALFSLVNAVIFRAPRVVEPDRLVRIRTGESLTSYPNYLDIRAHREVFSDVIAVKRETVTLEAGETLTAVAAESVSPDYFEALGVAAARGRVFAAGDPAPALVVSDRFWRTRLNADPDVVGRDLRLAGELWRIAGVMPPSFRGTGVQFVSADLWRRIDGTGGRELTDRAAVRFELIGRLAPGVTRDEASAAMSVIGANLERAHPADNAGLSQSTVAGIIGVDAFRGAASLAVPLIVFLGLVGLVSVFVLVIGCLNLSSMLLARAATRRSEIAVRLALGAGRGRLIRQLLTESLALSIMGACAGALLAWLAVDFVNRTSAGLPFPIPLQLDASVDRLAFAYAIGVSLVAALGFGLFPALAAPKVALVPALRDSYSRLPRLTRARALTALIVGQIAVCAALLLCSGLFLRSMVNASSVDPGFDPRSTLVTAVSPDDRRYDEKSGAALYDRIVERVRLIRGVRSASLALVVPLSLSGREEFTIGVEGFESDRRARRVLANRISPGYFETLRIPLAGGRDFAPSDREDAAAVVIVDETLARRFWPGENPVGRTIQVPGTRSGPDPVPATIVGVVRASKYWTLGETGAPVVYMPLAQHYIREATLHVRLAEGADEAAVAREVRQELARIDPLLAVQTARLADKVAIALWPARIGSIVTGGFGVLAAALAMIGIYGVTAFAVAARQREMGIRKALGARDSDLVRLVARRVFGMSAAGVAAGLALAVPAALALRPLLVGVSPVDPVVAAGVALAVFAITAAAAGIPAARAAMVDPMATLRTE